MIGEKSKDVQMLSEMLENTEEAVATKLHTGYSFFIAL